MAKYTLELGTIQEGATNGIFSFDYDFYTDDLEIRKKFESKFIEHYYFHEIGQETTGRFRHMLRSKLNKIMPFYNQLYVTELKSKNIEFLLNKDYTETFTKEIDRIEDRHNSSTSDNSSVNTTINNTTDNSKSSSLDNGVASVGLENNKLTSVDQSVVNTDNKNTSNSKTDNVENGNLKGLENENYTLIGKGNIGTTSSAQLLTEWRKVLINIDEMLIEECRDLFMLIY